MGLGAEIAAPNRQLHLVMVMGCPLQAHSQLALKLSSLTLAFIFYSVPATVLNFDGITSNQESP
jgi:hypothetical protein